MAVMLRLTRSGAKKRPFYRIVAADKASPRDGKFLEILGTYHPLAPKAEDRINLKKDKIEKWIQRGAKPTGTVRQLIKKVNRG